MKKIEKARELARYESRTVVFYSRGDNISFGAKGSGTLSGYRINTNSVIDNLIIYLKPKRNKESKIFFGSVSHIKKLSGSTKNTVFFTHLKQIGVSTNNWFEFA